MNVQKSITLVILSLLLVTALTISSCSKGSEVIKQTYASVELKIGDVTICPVMGKKFTVKEDTKYAEVNGKKYYVCCPSCISKIQEDPDEFLKEDTAEESHEGHDHE